jgi:hypothetical protein
MFRGEAGIPSALCARDQLEWSGCGAKECEHQNLSYVGDAQGARFVALEALQAAQREEAEGFARLGLLLACQARAGGASGLPRPCC